MRNIQSKYIDYIYIIIIHIVSINMDFTFCLSKMRMYMCIKIKIEMTCKIICVIFLYLQYTPRDLACSVSIKKADFLTEGLVAKQCLLFTGTNFVIPLQ